MFFQLDSAARFSLRGPVGCQLVTTATYLFSGWTVDDTAALPNSPHGRYSPLATMTPINDPRQVEMSEGAAEERRVYLWKRGRVLRRPEPVRFTRRVTIKGPLV